VTIAVGFLCTDGIVLGADTQYTQHYTTFGLKTQGPKLFVVADRPDLAVIVAGAGSVSFMKMAVDKLKQAFSGLSIPSGTQIRDTVEVVLLDFFTKHVYNVPDYKQPDFKLLIGARTNRNDFSLWETSLTSVAQLEEWDHVCIGIGNTVSSYALTITRGAGLVEWAKLRAAFCVNAAKRNVDGCGGPTRLLTLTANGVEHVGVLEIEAAEKYADELLAYIGTALNYAEENEFMTDDDVVQLATALSNEILRFRSKAKELRETIHEEKEATARRRAKIRPPAAG
jgi:20S proteasome alpha/beta subunit